MALILVDSEISVTSKITKLQQLQCNASLTGENEKQDVNSVLFSEGNTSASLDSGLS